MKTKYISFKKLGSNFSEMVIFPETIKHSDMKKSLGNIDIIGAGFVNFRIRKDEYDCDYVKFICSGKSESLNIISHEDDSELAQRLFGEEY
jgi:hypothetical protein